MLEKGMEKVIVEAVVGAAAQAATAYVGRKCVLAS